METAHDPLGDGFRLVELFAGACERMNDFARQQRDEGRPARAGTDIRAFRHGARLEKWVELDLDAGTGRVYCWWLEMGIDRANITVLASVSIAHGEFNEDFRQSARSLEDAAEALDDALRWLEGKRSVRE